LLLVEITKPDAKLDAKSKIRKDVEEILKKAMKQVPEAEQLARAHGRFLATRARALASPGAMALYLAQVWALTGKPPTAVLKVTSQISGADIQRMCQQMFAEGKRTLLVPGEGG
jgi:hypothetical protein